MKLRGGGPPPKNTHERKYAGFVGVVNNLDLSNLNKRHENLEALPALRADIQSYVMYLPQNSDIKLRFVALIKNLSELIESYSKIWILSIKPFHAEQDDYESRKASLFSQSFKNTAVAELQNAALQVEKAFDTMFSNNVHLRNLANNVIKNQDTTADAITRFQKMAYFHRAPDNFINEIEDVVYAYREAQKAGEEGAPEKLQTLKKQENLFTLVFFDYDALKLDEAYELGRKSREVSKQAAAKQEIPEQAPTDQAGEEEVKNLQGHNNNMNTDPSRKADDDKDKEDGKGKGKEKEENEAQSPNSNATISDDDIAGSDAGGIQSSNIDPGNNSVVDEQNNVTLGNDSTDNTVEIKRENDDPKIRQNNDMESNTQNPNNTLTTAHTGDQGDQQQDIFNSLNNSDNEQPITNDINFPTNTPLMTITPETVQNAFKETAKLKGFPFTVIGNHAYVTHIEREMDNLGANLIIHHFNGTTRPVILDGNSTEEVNANYKAAAKSLGQSMLYFFMMKLVQANVTPRTEQELNKYRRSLPKFLDGGDIFAWISDPQKFREKIAEVQSKLTAAQSNNRLLNAKYAQYAASLKEVEKWLDAIDEYCIMLGERGVSNIGTHYRKEQEKRAFVIIKSLCVALVGLAVGYFGMLELAISQGWILQGVAPGTTVLAQGQDAMIELYRQLLATNPEFILIAAISAAVLAGGAVALYHYFRNSPEPLTTKEQEKYDRLMKHSIEFYFRDSVGPLTKEQQEKHDRLMKNPILFFECFSKNKDEVRRLFTHQEVIQMLSGVVINEAKHPGITSVEKQHFQDVSDTLCNIYHEMKQQITNVQQTTIS